MTPHKAYFELLGQPDGEGDIINWEETAGFCGIYAPPRQLVGPDIKYFHELLEDHTNRYGKPSQQEKLEIRNRVMRFRSLRFSVARYIREAIDRRTFESEA